MREIKEDPSLQQSKSPFRVVGTRIEEWDSFCEPQQSDLLQGPVTQQFL